MSETLLEVKHLKKYFNTKAGLLHAVDDVSFSIAKGETLGLVGESGCGKSTTGKMIVKLLTPTEGTIEYKGKDIFKVTKEEDKELKKEIQIIFQDPYSSLDPKFTVGRIVGEPLLAHGVPSAERKERVMELLKQVGIREDFYNRYPHEFSGGQRQRIGVARSLALNPKLIVCDEPVSALDVSIQAQILNLMAELQKEYNLTYLFISHNLSVVKHICDRIAVMYLGNIVELADKEGLFDEPMHPYTQALLDAIPIPDPDVKSMSGSLSGDVPSPLNPPSGCCFHTRCKYATAECAERKPALTEVRPGHFAACHRCMKSSN